MTSVRVYGGALAFDEAIAEVRRSTGGQFDPSVAGVLVELLGEGAVTRAAGDARAAEAAGDATLEAAIEAESSAALDT
jgi:HD-GYP domain-containing protein (c-di-GMP phosphodiesterase class II)